MAGSSQGPREHAERLQKCLDKFYDGSDTKQNRATLRKCEDEAFTAPAVQAEKPAQVPVEAKKEKTILPKQYEQGKAVSEPAPASLSPAQKFIRNLPTIGTGF